MLVVAVEPVKRRIAAEVAAIVRVEGRELSAIFSDPVGSIVKVVSLAGWPVSVTDVVTSTFESYIAPAITPGMNVHPGPGATVASCCDAAAAGRSGQPWTHRARRRSRRRVVVGGHMARTYGTITVSPASSSSGAPFAFDGLVVVELTASAGRSRTCEGSGCPSCARSP